MLTLLLIGTLTLAFNTQPVKASGTIYIRADGSIDPPTAPIHRDGDVYTFTNNIYDSIVIERDNIVIDGTGKTIQGTEELDSRGIDLSNRVNVTVRNTRITAFSYGVCLNYSSINSISGNDLNDNRFFGIVLISSLDNSISQNNVTNNNGGVVLFSSLNNSIVGNNIKNNDNHGIAFSFSSNSSISRNNITDNYNGIYLESSSNFNSITENNVIHNFYGIWGEFSSDYNNISGNNIKNNDVGIGLPNSSYNSISGNNVTDNNYGIDILWDSSDNSIVGNNIKNNIYGIALYFRSNNKFWHNNFINNTQQVYIPYSGYANFWDDGYPSGGNYWSDYAGVDVKKGSGQDLPGSDGIGDTPYIIDANNRDQYPLMTPYGAPPPSTYTLTITTTVGGTTDPSLGIYSYTAHSSVQVTAIPYADYTFDHWELNNVTISVYLGISYDPSYTGGLLVMSIVPGGPADKAGLIVGDVIKQVDSLQVNRAEDLVTYVQRYKNPGDIVVLKINRSNLIMEITLTLERAPVGFPNPCSVLMDNNHTLKAVFTYSPPPPLLTASISPLSSSILVGQSVTFASTVSGGYTPYSYQWYLNGAPVSGATSNTWTFTSTSGGIYYVYLKVTDAKGNIAQSETARIAVTSVPVGGYSIPIQARTTTKPLTPYLILTAILTIAFTTIKRKTTRKPKQQ